MNEEKEFGDGQPCPNIGCKYHPSWHPCPMCGRVGARGIAKVKMGLLVIWKEREIHYGKEKKRIGTSEVGCVS
jgi:hypothetical protein